MTRGEAVSRAIDELCACAPERLPVAVRSCARFLGNLVGTPGQVVTVPLPDGQEFRARWGTLRGVAEGWVLAWAERAGLPVVEILILFNEGIREVQSGAMALRYGPGSKPPPAADEEDRWRGEWAPPEQRPLSERIQKIAGIR